MIYEKFRYLTITNFIYFKTPLFAIYERMGEDGASHKISYITMKTGKMQPVLEHFRKGKRDYRRNPVDYLLWTRLRL